MPVTKPTYPIEELEVELKKLMNHEYHDQQTHQQQKHWQLAHTNFSSYQLQHNGNGSTEAQRRSNDDSLRLTMMEASDEPPDDTIDGSQSQANVEMVVVTVSNEEEHQLEEPKMSRSLRKKFEFYRKTSSEFAKTAILPRRERTPMEVNQEDSRLSYNAQYNCSMPPIFILTITFMEILFFIYDVIHVESMDAPNQKFQRTKLNKWLYYTPRKRQEVWRYCTYALVHIGYSHISFIVLSQLTLGTLLEMVHSWWRVMIIYIAGVIGGSLALSVLMPDGRLTGASAGAYALFAAHLSTILLNWSEMESPWISVILFFLYVLWDIANVVRGYYENGTIISHMGGAIIGLLVGILVLRNLKVRKWEYCLYFISAILLLGLVSFAVAWNVQFGPYYNQPKS